MKRTVLFIGLVVSVFAFSGIVSAQKQIVPTIDRDPLMELDAMHNLDVAQQYFGVRKAYKSVISRFEETFAAYPDFSKIDEFLYIVGMSSYYLADNKGKQKVDLKNEKDKERFAPAKLRQEARMYLSMIVDKYPESRYRADAEETLKLLPEPKAEIGGQ